MSPEDKARQRIDEFLDNAGWTIVPRDEFTPDHPTAVMEALMLGNTESDYLLFVDGNAIAVLEAKREENALKKKVETQAEQYAHTPQNWYGLWCNGLIPLVYMSNGTKILFKNLLTDQTEYTEIDAMHSPKEMLRLIGQTSSFGALPKLKKGTLRDCQFSAENTFERYLREGKKKNLAVLATGSGKTYLACLASYRLLNYTSVKKVLFLVDRNNLARQTESEFSQFNLTEKQVELGSLYLIRRLRKEEDIKATVVISTIQKLYAVMTGQQLSEDNEDAEDETNTEAEDKNANETVQLGDNVKLSPDYFDLIIVDECHRSIYGKWKAVLDYFSNATILGLTATPTPEAEAFFNGNYVERYTIEKSEDDGVNVPARIYRIATEITEHGGSIKTGTTVQETVKRTGTTTAYTAKQQVEYDASALDRTVINRSQIIEVLTRFKESIYRELYPEREVDWEHIPKTLIFAKDDNHATEIVEAAKSVFKTEFPDEILPDGFVQKITYSAGDSNALIRDLRTEREFRIAVTVTLVATGTDVKPLEIVLFMKDVQSDVLYTQMKGRGCRTISEDKLKEVTPNAKYKECYYIVDAVGVTEHEKKIPRVNPGPGPIKKLTLYEVLEHLSHKELSDDNLMLLRDYCASIHNRYEYHPLFGYHLTEFINSYGFSPRDLSSAIRDAFDNNQLPPFYSPSDENKIRWQLIAKLMSNVPARKKLLELHKGYIAITEEDPDKLIFQGFSVETAKEYIENFQKYIMEHKDDIEALRIIYNSEDVLIWAEDAINDEHMNLCSCCFDDHYRRCENCGRLVHDNDVLWSNDLPYCAHCYDNLDVEIEEYSYKPEPIFYGEGSRYFGVELEIDCGGKEDDNAGRIKAEANTRNEYIYIKSDGSLDDGFEIVTHPMTLDFHMKQMYWEDVLKEAVRLGYKSHMTSTCGLHIHVNRDAFGENEAEQEKVIERLLFFVETHWNELFTFSRRSPHNINRWAARYGMEKSGKEILDKAKKGNLGRYAAVNLCPYQTIEFRIFRGTLKLNTLYATLQLVNKICDVALFMSEKEIGQQSWGDFVQTITEPELIQYLKERRLYVNDPVEEEGEEQ